MQKFRALLVNKTPDLFSVDIKELSLDDLPQGDLTVRVAYSSVNYKDGLASIPDGRIIKSYPFIPGIDLAGTVVSSQDARFHEGDEVLVTGYELGITHFGGFSEYARVPVDWVVPLPDGLTLKEAMVYGTAGFTAALSLHKLEVYGGLKPEVDPVLVTGATGGVGSFAISMLSKKGYHVMASTGKVTEHEYLNRLGASEILDRSQFSPEAILPLDKQLWAGAIDPVGGRTLAYILSKMKYGGSVAACGLTGGTEFPATVYPFILRGVNLFGIDSVFCPMDLRVNLWQQMADELKHANLMEDIGQEVTLDELPGVLSNILEGKIRGRTIVTM